MYAPRRDEKASSSSVSVVKRRRFFSHRPCGRAVVDGKPSCCHTEITSHRHVRSEQCRSSRHRLCEGARARCSAERKASRRCRRVVAYRARTPVSAMQMWRDSPPLVTVTALQESMHTVGVESSRASRGGHNGRRWHGPPQDRRVVDP
jgi:hypothetical protein